MQIAQGIERYKQYRFQQDQDREARERETAERWAKACALDPLLYGCREVHPVRPAQMPQDGVGPSPIYYTATEQQGNRQLEMYKNMQEQYEREVSDSSL